MGLFEKIFGRRNESAANGTIFRMPNGYTPRFTTWTGRLYENALVRSAIHARASHISKLQIAVQGPAKPKLQTQLRLGPNAWQTWGQFLYRLSTILDMQNTAFIVPVLDSFGESVGVFPVLPSRCDLREYAGEAWVRYDFGSGQYAAVELHRCGIMTKFQYTDDLLGESNSALSPTMELIDIQNQGISEGVRASASFRFMARLNNFSKPEDLSKERKRFTAENLRGDGGVLLFPNTYDQIQQIKSTPFVVDADQMTAIEKNVYTYFGVNDDVLQNKAYGDAWSAFYEGAIEPFAVQLSDVLTQMLFTTRERAAGTFVMATSNRLQYMSNADKLRVSQGLADRGIMNRDEIREIWNLPPLPDGLGQDFPVRGEYYALGRKKEDHADGNE